MGNPSLSLLLMGIHASKVSLDSNPRKDTMTSLHCICYNTPYFIDQGILICIGGLGLLVASDDITDKDYPAVSKVKGDIFMIIGASLYGFSTFSIHHSLSKLKANRLNFFNFQQTQLKNSLFVNPHFTKS